VCFACGVTLLYTVDDSGLQIREVWLWDRISEWSDLFASAVCSLKLASLHFLGGGVCSVPCRNEPCTWIMRLYTIFLSP
jgi:hypothetical protein